ncbi:MAG: hypothetical protein OXT09_05585 [Myxococcales bacterium]|nr:hypothetical protein [Myxococcales bacterium]
MTRPLTRILLTAALWLSVAVPAMAEGNDGVTRVGDGVTTLEQQAKLQTIDRKRKKVRKRAKGQMVVASVPELDPNAAGLALVLLIGGTLLLVDRRRVRV